MKSKSLNKYRNFPLVDLPDRTWPSKSIEKSPQWCSVDLRDGNQALAVPMSVESKLEYFKLLLDIGFKQIEVGFPSASQIEFDFIRMLVDEGLIPDDVQIQVLVQAKEKLLRRTFESLSGVKQSIVHLYNSTSTLQRKVTFRNATREDIKKIAIDGTQIVVDLAEEFKSSGYEVMFQYSPESFSDTELDFSLDVCEGVKEIWHSKNESDIILNLPATVEWTTPNVHADQIEWFGRNISDRQRVIISLHTHNDRGTGVAATELGLLAGADRVEGTLFGNGERTGNLDIATCALNMNSHGINTGLDFSDIKKVVDVYKKSTGMDIHPRHPYAGDLVFTAFSGSHQDAIKKGMDLLKGDSLKIKNKNARWEVPYLLIDPKDIGRTYNAIIRINSQSGKGGVAYILEREFGFDLPKDMHPVVGEVFNKVADSYGRELATEEIVKVFEENFVNLSNSISLSSHNAYEDLKDETEVPKGIRWVFQGKIEDKSGDIIYDVNGRGNGPINACVNAVKNCKELMLDDFSVLDYRSHAISKGSDSDSVAYVCIKMFREGQSDEEVGRKIWGCGIDPSIETAGIKALFSALNFSKKYL